MMAVSTTSHPAVPQTLDPVLARRVDAAVLRVLNEDLVPSASIAIARGGGLAYAAAYGRAGLSPVPPATTQTRYRRGNGAVPAAGGLEGGHIRLCEADLSKVVTVSLVHDATVLHRPSTRSIKPTLMRNRVIYVTEGWRSRSTGADENNPNRWWNQKSN
jgi:hypothetical protein